jgi:site-specific DNA recombinase
MRRAVLYARVSTHLQEKEGTIDSQLAEIKRQIAKNGDELITEYTDNGYSGAYLDRPAMNDLREALKTDRFDAVYFLATDRIARDSIHQDIIVNEILRYKKKVIINDKDYEKNPENEFALRVFGAVSQFERAKIMERMQRGRMHRLRNGHLMPNGHTIYGYRYIRKTPEKQAQLVIHEEEASVLRYMFTMYANGSLGTNALPRSLEERGILSRKGKQTWNVEIIKRMLKNPTYTGVRYFNKMTREEAPMDNTRKKYRKFIDRDRSEWIGIPVPAIISQELFNKVQERLQKTREKYRRPKLIQLLSGLAKCGECGHSYCSVRWYGKKTNPSGTIRVSHWNFYQCSMRMYNYMHDPHKRKPCGNNKITSHILEDAVMRIIQDNLLDPVKLSFWITRSEQHMPNEHAARELARIAGQLKKLDETRRRLINGYATGRTVTKKYIERNHVIDTKFKKLTREKTELTNASHDRHGTSGIQLQQFCAHAKVQFAACTDLETKRKFLQEHVEKIIFNHDKISIIGFIPAQGDTTALPFQIEGEIDRAHVRSNAQRKNRREIITKN